MKKILLNALLLMLLKLVVGQNSFYAFVDSANHITDPADRVAYVEALINHLDTVGAPLIEGDTANFIYYGAADTVEIAGDFNGWGGNGVWLCERIPETNFFYHSHIFEQTARLDYKLIVDINNWILDPLNPKKVSGGYGPNSELAMPSYIQPWEIVKYEGVAHGTIESFNLKSEVLNKNFGIQVYLPPGYNANQQYPTVYVHDGQEYISLGSMNNVIDNLLDSNLIDPIIGVFIRPNNRNDEYADAQRNDYAQFITETVVPYIDANYNSIKSKDFRLTMGASFGGNISGLIAYNYPEIFANSGWHSPALWPNDGEVAKMYITEAKNVKIYFNAGTYEDLGVDWEAFTEGLTALEYTYAWKKYNEGHSWGFWRATTDDILKFFFSFGSTPVGITNKLETTLTVGQNYPNPFKTLTTIPISINQSGKYNFSVYNSKGQPILAKSVSYSSLGNYSIQVDGSKLAVGIYYYVLENKKHRVTGKMIVH